MTFPNITPNKRFGPNYEGNNLETSSVLAVNENFTVEAGQSLLVLIDTASGVPGNRTGTLPRLGLVGEGCIFAFYATGAGQGILVPDPVDAAAIPLPFDRAAASLTLNGAENQFVTLEKVTNPLDGTVFWRTISAGAGSAVNGAGVASAFVAGAPGSTAAQVIAVGGTFQAVANLVAGFAPAGGGLITFVPGLGQFVVNGRALVDIEFKGSVTPEDAASVVSMRIVRTRLAVDTVVAGWTKTAVTAQPMAYNLRVVELGELGDLYTLEITSDANGDAADLVDPVAVGRAG